MLIQWLACHGQNKLTLFPLFIRDKSSTDTYTHTCHQPILASWFYPSYPQNINQIEFPLLLEHYWLISIDIFCCFFYCHPLHLKCYLCLPTQHLPTQRWQWLQLSDLIQQCNRMLKLMKETYDRNYRKIIFKLKVSAWDDTKNTAAIKKYN